ncbi:MAG TPA: HD-GYP domain-containing protein [Gaiellaceae bacterium]|nr:HD-GYP domain-containing protein [Gaiellaceae bacterium]
MALIEHQAPPNRGQLALPFDPDADEAVGEHRSELARGLTPRERLAALLIGGSFLAAAGALSSTIPAHRFPSLGVVALYVLVYALVSRMEFEVLTGAHVPTQLVLVPMLFVLPLHIVPLAVAAGLMFGSVLDWAKRRTSLERAPLNLVSSWHAVGPVLVLGLAGDGLLAWAQWPVYAAALLAQFALEIASVTAYERIARGTAPTTLLRHLGRSQLVDAALALAALGLADEAERNPYALLLSLPFVWLLSVFARERHARIDNALELSAAYRGTALLLGDIVEADDAYTGLHTRDVVGLAVAVADQLGLPAAETRDTEFAALLHDVGKIRVPSEIINKPGALTPQERAIIERHTIEGERMLKQVGGLLGNIGHLVRSCHERWDGRGYPDGLAGEAIPRVARIVMCCDALSAMTSDRSYRRALPLEAALDELRANAGTQFDPAVVEALIAVVERGGRLSRE